MTSAAVEQPTDNRLSPDSTWSVAVEGHLLDSVLSPGSIAIVGATDDPNKPAGRVQRYLRTYGFEGHVYPVTPSRDSAQGVATAASVQSIGADVDLAVIAVPAAAVPAALRDCAAAGVRSAVVFSSGFGEGDESGQGLEHELREAIGGSNLRVIGPNCNGTISTRGGATATFMTGLDQDRFDLRDDGVAFVTQSGAFGAFVFNLAQSTGLGIGTFLSTGNEVDVSFADIVHELILRGDVRVILGYLEGVRDGDRFVQALRTAAEADVPLALVKVGGTQVGARAAASHTGALAGVDRVYDGILRQFGARRVNSVERLLDVGRLFAFAPLGPRGRMTILTLSGGAGVLMADVGQALGVSLASWDEAWRSRLQSVLPPYASLDNPLDMTGTMVSDPTILGGALEIVNAHPDTDVIVVVLGNLEMQEEPIVSTLRKAHAEADKPLIVTWVGGSGRPSHLLNAAKIPTFADPTRTVEAIAEAIGWARNQQSACKEEESNNGEVCLSAGEDRIPAGVLDEYETKQLLAAHGFPVVDEAVARDPDEAVGHAEALGYPVVAKLLASGLTHKSELGAVETDLASPDAVHQAATRLLRLGSQHQFVSPAVLIQQQADGHLELLIGMSRDDVFGPVITIGFGGVLAELLDDVAVLLPPFRHGDIDRALTRLRGAPLLQGLRGEEPIDIDAVRDAICRFGEFVAAHANSLSEIDLNPVIVGGKRVPLAAVDALLIGRERELQ